MSIILAKQGSVQGFGYEILLTKASNPSHTYDMSRLCVETAIYESLFQKAVTLSTTIYDGAGFMDKVGIELGDTFQVTLFKDVNQKPRILKRFKVIGISAGVREVAQAKAYTVNCISEMGYNGIGTTVRRSLKGTVDSIVRTICNSFLKTPLNRADEFPTTIQLIGSGQTAFQMIDACVHRSGGDASFFFETLDNLVHFQKLRTITAEAEHHQYILAPDKSSALDGTDYYRIANLKQTKHSNLLTKLGSGLTENIFLFIDPLNRKFKKGRVFEYMTDHAQLTMLGQYPLETRSELTQTSTHQQDDKLPMSTNIVVSETAYDRVEPMAVNGELQAPQRASFDQLSYTMLVLGNPSLQAGDVIDVVAGAMSDNGAAGGYDTVLHGPWLVGNVRHVITAPESYMTTVDVFRNSYTQERR